MSEKRVIGFIGSNNQYIIKEIVYFVFRIRCGKLCSHHSYNSTPFYKWLVHGNNEILKSKPYDFETINFLHSFSIAAISETSLNSTVSNCEIIDPSFYTIFRCDPVFPNINITRGGGLCVAIFSTLCPINLKSISITIL